MQFSAFLHALHALAVGGGAPLTRICMNDALYIFKIFLIYFIND